MMVQQHGVIYSVCTRLGPEESPQFKGNGAFLIEQAAQTNQVHRSLMQVFQRVRADCSSGHSCGLC
ncbi:hypothetical protein AB205_0200290 [Aquarana catesbeiana]|uniref:Uncharacterized protein n=1 Tax=Aquarana catesbeiana TaxID=8400 RepID=A0A2G9RCI2_AQUCT|nr:hypothetical protein AB205_0200290 [Aquarana catesbeiana]PIO25550.1 hypothetical protein AB205_0200290 [Aquarana catesbeiana]PIO25552.1 hypothetical protein AB205_0200290 [Aquarana catesbeiana]PIO25553.1 hypothetical protein AB205_0200290 [Aquarana catesbeiana]PIO25554.1 hypothetical protein AB205_0200290 [Aquarana catesbeiana]